MANKTDLKKFISYLKKTKGITPKDNLSRFATREDLRKEEDVLQIRKDIKTIVNFFDGEYLESRIGRR